MGQKGLGSALLGEGRLFKRACSSNITTYNDLESQIVSSMRNAQINKFFLSNQSHLSEKLDNVGYQR